MGCVLSAIPSMTKKRFDKLYSQKTGESFHEMEVKMLDDLRNAENEYQMAFQAAETLEVELLPPSPASHATRFSQDGKVDTEDPDNKEERRRNFTVAKAPRIRRWARGVVKHAAGSPSSSSRGLRRSELAPEDSPLLCNGIVKSVISSDAEDPPDRTTRIRRARRAKLALKRDLVRMQHQLDEQAQQSTESEGSDESGQSEDVIQVVVDPPWRCSVQ